MWKNEFRMELLLSAFVMTYYESPMMVTSDGKSEKTLTTYQFTLIQIRRAINIDYDMVYPERGMIISS